MMSNKMTDGNDRPTAYTEEIGMQIGERLFDGESLRAICRDTAMPTWETIQNWLAHEKDFRDEYESVQRELQRDLEDELLEIVDDGSRDWVEKVRWDGKVVTVFDSTELARCSLRLDVRCWVADQRFPNNTVKFTMPRKGK